MTWRRLPLDERDHVAGDFYPHGRVYRIADLLNLANPGWQCAFEQLAAGRLRL